MGNSDLISICISAFLAVVILLSLLAMMIRLITLIYPKQEETQDAAVIAAISSTYAALFPESKITKIGEEK